MPPLPSPRTAFRRQASALASVAGAAILAVFGLAGCASSAPKGTLADPAGAVPAGAVLYVGANVRPQGLLKSRALATGRALTHQADPYTRLLAILQTPGSAPLSFSSDVAPWLGPNAGVFLSSSHGAGALGTLLEHGLLGSSGASTFPFSRAGAQGAIVLDTSNPSRAQTFLQAQAARAGARRTSFEGVSYEASSEGVAFMLLHKLVVIGSEAAVQSVIQTIHGGDGLASSSAYAKLLAAGPASVLAHVYVSAHAAAAADTHEALGSLEGLLAGIKAANVSLVPRASSLSLDVDTAAASPGARGDGLLAYDPQAAQALDELPGESWLAVGLGHLGTQIGGDAHAIQALASLLAGAGASSAGLSLGSLVQAMLAPLQVLGADTRQARSAFASWMGSAGIFASGASLLELKGAIVVSSTNPARSRTAVGALAEALRRGGASVSTASIPGTEAAVDVGITGLPVKLAIADGRAGNGQSKFVIGLGEASVPAALTPSSTMSAASARIAAAASLGEGIEPSVIVNIPALLSLLEGVGLLEQQPVAQLLPYLRSTTTIAAGARQLGAGAQRFRVVLGLQG